MNSNVCIVACMWFISNWILIFSSGRKFSGDPETCEAVTLEPPTTTTDPITTTTERSLLADICRGITFGIIPHPETCTQYIVCLNEAPTIITCGSLEVFYNGACVEGELKI